MSDISGFWGGQSADELAGQFSEGGKKTLPPGWHDAVIAKTEMKGTQEGSGMNLFIFFDFAGTEKRECFNLKKQNGEVNEWTRPVLAKLSIAAGVKGNLTDPMQLHGLRVSCKLGQEDYTNNDGKVIKVNNFLNYKPAGSDNKPAGDNNPFGGGEQKSNAAKPEPEADVPW